MLTCHVCGYQYSCAERVRVCPLCDELKRVKRWDTTMYVFGILTILSLAFFWVLTFLPTIITGLVFLICVFGTLLSRQRKLELMLTKLT